MPKTRSVKVWVQKSANALWHLALLSDSQWWTNCGFNWSRVVATRPLNEPPPQGHMCSNCQGDDE